MKFIILALTLALFFCSTGYSKVYKWLDEYGNIVISNEKPKNHIVKEIKIDRSVLKLENVWEVKNKATKELEKMLKKIEDERKKNLEEEKNIDEEPVDTNKVVKKENVWLPLKGMARNSTGEIEVSVVEKDPKKYKDIPYSIYKVTIENQATTAIKFSRVFTKVYLKNDSGVSHSYIQKKIALKKELAFADEIPEDESIGPLEKKKYTIAFSPVEKPTIVLFDKFKGIDDGAVEIDIIKDVPKEIAKKTKDIKLGELDDFNGENLFNNTSSNSNQSTKKTTTSAKKSNSTSEPSLVPALPPSIIQKDGGLPPKKNLPPPHPLLGLECEKLDRSLISKYNINSKSGLFVTKVILNSSAYNANIKKGDVIETVNNTPVNRIDDLRSIISDASIGEPLNFYINRKNTWSTYQAIKR